ncbi:MAG: HEPN domain-containing protein [Bacteroidales bacterium]|nr:HEPN domain-containing protein [Bacteroidales bacterium]MBS3776222.1 HEPN domain-containing protein [Bacteroidales bacterium]
MTIDNREDYIRYRLQRAEESYEDALILAKNQRWNAVVNRLYYACFYAVIALLLQNNIETQSHDGTRTQFGLHFVKTGLIDKKYGKLYSKLFDFRQKGDYGDLYDYDGITISPLINSVREFIDVIKQLM